MHECLECGKTFSIKCALVMHLRTHSGDKPFQCPTCSKCFTQSGHLKEHIRTHTGERPYQCATCGKAFLTGTRLRVHMKTHIPRNAPQTIPPLHTCSTCQKGFNHIVALRTHQLTHDENKLSAMAMEKRKNLMTKRFSCDLCGAAFRFKHSLKKHLITHTGLRPHVCSHCSKSFTQASHLNLHMSTHNNVPSDHKCKVCGIKCESAINAKKHAKSHNGNNNGSANDINGGVTYKCSVCSENFQILARLKRHMQRHTGEKIFKCGICSRSFGESAMLVSHMRTHSGERPFECKICSKRFAQRSVLRCHLKIHTGEKRHVCDVCGKRFITQSDVVKHSRVHTKEKPFACQFCNSCFSRSNHLSRHIKIHFRSKKTNHQADNGDCIQSNTIDNLYDSTHTVNANPPPVQGTGSFLKVNNLFGYFESIERSSMKTIHPNDSFEQNKFVQQEEHFIDFQNTLDLQQVHESNDYTVENHREREMLKYNFEMYNVPRFQYETNNEIGNRMIDSGNNIYGQEIIQERIEKVIVPVNESRIKLACNRWRYPNTGAHLKNSCKEVSNKTINNSKPWQCGICDESFKEQKELKEHINEHKSLMTALKYTKLVKNPETGKLEEKDVIPRNNLKIVSLEVVEPIINAHFAKDKLTDPPIHTINEEQPNLDPNIETSQFEDVREYTDWTHEQQNYRDTVIIERQEYFKECQEKQIMEDYERGPVVIDINVAEALNQNPNYVYDHETPTIGQDLSCQNILDIQQQYKTNDHLTNTQHTTHNIYSNNQTEYLQINECHGNNIHQNEIDHAINYVYQQESNVMDQTDLVHMHQEENAVHVPNDIVQPIEYIYEHKKGFIAQKMSLMHNANIAINNGIDQAMNFNYQQKEMLPHDKNIHMNNEVDETTNYIYDLKNEVIGIPNNYGNIIVNIHDNETQLHTSENELFNINVKCPKSDKVVNKINYESNYKENNEYIINHDGLDKPVYLSEDVCVENCLDSHLKTIQRAETPNAGLCQSEFSFLDHSDEQDILEGEKSVINETIEEYRFNNGPLLEDSYDNIDSLPAINPATQEIQETSSNVSPSPLEENGDSVIKKCETVKHKQTFECDECPNGVIDTNSLIVHMCSHNRIKPFECTECPAKFKKRVHLQEHLLIHSNQKDYQCHHCEKRFIKSSQLKTHMKTHSEEKEFKCNICEKSFNNRLGWQIHQNTHSEETLYNCEICGKDFRHESTLIAHQRTHSGERPYSCSICQASFSQISTLISHKRIHTDSRPHVCSQCSKSFRSMGVLTRHMQTHSGIRNFACIDPDCLKTFVRKSHLQRHMITHKIVDSVT